MFTEDQIQEIVDIIDFQSNFFIAGNISDKVLSHKDKLLLTKLGLDYRKPIEGMTPFQQSFYWGRLVSALGPLRSKNVNLNDFKQYLRRGQFKPLSEYEKLILNYLEKKTFGHIKDLSETIKTTIVNKVREVELINRPEYEKIIKDAVKKTVLEKRVVSDIVSEIGSQTKDWSRNLGRIAETELQNAYEYGKMAAFSDSQQDEFYKQVYGGACKHCIKLFLTNGFGSKPILFSYEKLLSNGTNIGRKTKDWKATVGPIHPHCRCDLRKKRKGDVWDESKKQFLPKKIKKSKGKIKITVGDKQFIV